MTGKKGNGGGPGGMPNNAPQRGQMHPPRGPRAGGGGGRGGGASPAPGHGVSGSDHGGGNRGGRGAHRGGRGGGHVGDGGRGKREGPFNSWPDGHPDAQRDECPELTYDDEDHRNAQVVANNSANNSSGNVAPATQVSDPASSNTEILRGWVKGVQVIDGDSSSSKKSAVSTPHLSTPAKSSAVPSTTRPVNPLSLPAATEKTDQSNRVSSVQGNFPHDASAMTVTNPSPASLSETTARKASATAISRAASLAPSTPTVVFDTPGSKRMPSFGTPSFATSNTSSLFRSSTPAASSFSLNASAVQPLQSNAPLLLPSASTDSNINTSWNNATSSVLPAFPPTPSFPFSTTQTPFLTFASSALTVAPKFAAFRPQFSEYRDTPPCPSDPATTSALGSSGSGKMLLACLLLRVAPSAPATPTVLGKHGAANNSPQPILNQAAGAAPQANKRVKIGGQAGLSEEGRSTSSQVQSVSTAISQELQSWGDKLKEIDNEVEEQKKAWIKRQELEAWRDVERKKLATRREACFQVLQSAREKMDKIIADEARLQGEYLEKLAAIEKRPGDKA
ncbi:hypothetical protein V8F20_006210 [Naviculisporaceae sp. PSN 640]